MIRTETVLDSWKTCRQDTALAVEEMPELEFKATPEMQSFRECAVHLLHSSQGLVGLLLEGEENFQTPEFRQRLARYFTPVAEDADGATLAAALRESMDQMTAQLGAQPGEFFSHLITRFDGQKVTRLEMVQFVKEHELTHRSQLFMMLRLRGIIPATTRRRQAAKPAAK